ncbi:aldo/keto reductase [Kurthia massiliensis]|uniref:aldo/keto reductase n=1 Tax=Kurthia massiliensis TaxID=1033739 RepID=UPI00028964B2|nr:aldo/keto reductase [Kurthia massiliensis]
MRTRKLGQSELHISEIGFGCMSLPTDLQAARYMIDAAVDYGINYFDTADLYDKGVNEQIVGEALKEKRRDIYIASKVGNVWNEDGETWHWDASRTHIIEGFKESLRRLQTDYLDFYQLHGGTLDDQFEEITDAFEQLKKEGLIRAYGISSIRPNVIKTFLPMSEAAGVMMQYSALDRRPEEYFDYIQSQGASVVTRGTVAKGLLTNDWQRRLEKQNGYLTYTQQELADTLSNIAAQQPDVLTTALSYNLAHDAVASVIVGASSIEQLQQNMQAYERITPDFDATVIQQLTKQDRYTAHRD